MNDQPSLLCDRAFVVTGASRGIGRAIASGVSAAGGDVVAVSRSGDAPASINGTIEPIALDIRAADAPERVLNAAIDRFGTADGLVNNAGVIYFAPCEAYGDAEWDDLIDTNLTAPFRLSQAFARHWLENEVRGVIVNLGSVESEVAIENQVGYAATKGGILGLTRAMAVELAPRGIRVNAVGPGVIDTGMTGPLRTETEARIPAGRLGTTEQISDVVVYLLSDRSTYINGTILFADGGYTAR